MNKFIYKIKHIMQSKAILALLTVVGMIGTCTNVVVASAAPNVKQNVETTEVKLYTDTKFDDKSYKGTVKIPVGATNIAAAIIISNSSDDKDDYFRVPVIEGRKLAFRIVTDDNTKKKSYVSSFKTKDGLINDTQFNNQEFKPTKVYINTWTIKKLSRYNKVNLYDYMNSKEQKWRTPTLRGTVEIPVGATNLEAAIIIANSSDDDYLRRPIIEDRNLECEIVSKNGTQSYNYYFVTQGYDGRSDDYYNITDKSEFHKQQFEIGGYSVKRVELYSPMVKKIGR